MYVSLLRTKPNVRIVDGVLKISRKPGLTSWLVLSLSILAFFQIFRRLTDNLFVILVSLSGEIVFCLDRLATSEELCLDKKEKRAIITNSNWIFRRIRKIEIREIRHVGASLDLGLYFLSSDGKINRIDTRGLLPKEIQCLREKINNYLNDQ